MWIDNYFPPEWLQAGRIDDNEKFTEEASMSDYRKERVMWLGCQAREELEREQGTEWKITWFSMRLFLLSILLILLCQIPAGNSVRMKIASVCMPFAILPTLWVPWGGVWRFKSPKDGE